MARLRERHDTHMFQVERITKLLEQRGAATTAVMRDDVTPDHVADADLVVALGGDGTTLIASHKLDGELGATPLVGVNTDRLAERPRDAVPLGRAFRHAPEHRAPLRVHLGQRRDRPRRYRLRRVEADRADSGGAIAAGVVLPPS